MILRSRFRLDSYGISLIIRGNVAVLSKITPDDVIMDYNKRIYNNIKWYLQWDVSRCKCKTTPEIMKKSTKIASSQNCFTALIHIIILYNTSSYLYLHHITYYNCPSIPNIPFISEKHFAIMSCSAFCTLCFLWILLLNCRKLS